MPLRNDLLNPISPDKPSGDNLYYMGFLFTLTSLAVSLYQFSTVGSAEQIVQNFGIAIASTIAGITLRIMFNQMRRDPVEVVVSYVHHPIVPAISVWGHITLRSTATMHVVN